MTTTHNRVRESVDARRASKLRDDATTRRAMRDDDRDDENARDVDDVGTRADDDDAKDDDARRDDDDDAPPPRASDGASGDDDAWTRARSVMVDAVRVAWDVDACARVGEFAYASSVDDGFAVNARATGRRAANALRRLEAATRARGVGVDERMGEESDEDVEEMFVNALDAIDARCDEVDACVMAARGDDARATGASARDAVAAGGRTRTRRDVATTRPQSAFEDAVDNSLTNTFHNGLLKPVGYDSFQDFARVTRARLASDYPDFMRASGGMTLPTPMDDEHPLTVVDEEEALEALAAHLEECKEFAVDLEHHSYRSFKGFTCLMQISTREKDFIVDVLALRSRVRDALGKAFADQNTLKVMHGADNDVQWLQKDFGIFVASLFDTGQAARVLELPSKSLAYLLHHYCGIKANKKFQLADWRLRPLTREMMEYARGDTHNLLYVHDRLKEALAARGPNCIDETLERSRDVCLKRYVLPSFDEGSYYEDLLKTDNRKELNDAQLAVYAALFKWRDATAREEDESLGYVMPRELMLRVAISAPSTARALMQECRGEVPLVAKHAEALADLISRAHSLGAPSFKPPLFDAVAAPAMTSSGINDASERSSVYRNDSNDLTTIAPEPERTVAPVAVAHTSAAKRKRGGSLASLMGGNSSVDATSASIVPISQIFDVWGADAAPAPAAVHAKMVVEEQNVDTPSEAQRDKSPPRDEIELPGGIRVPAPFRKAGKDLPFTFPPQGDGILSKAEESADARAELAARRAERMRGYDESDSDSDDLDEMRAQVEAEMKAFDDPARHDVFTQLTKKRFGKSGLSLLLAEKEEAPKKGFNERFKSVYEEPFKAGPKSKSFPRSGNRFTTFDK